MFLLYLSLSLSCYTCLAYFGIIIVISFRSLRQRLEHSSHSSSLLSSPLFSLVLLVEVFWGHVRLGAFSSAGNSLKASEISAAFFPAPAFQRFSRFRGLHLPFTSGLDCPVPNSAVLCLRAFSPSWSTIFRAKLSVCCKIWIVFFVPYSLIFVVKHDFLWAAGFGSCATGAWRTGVALCFHIRISFLCGVTWVVFIVFIFYSYAIYSYHIIYIYIYS